MVSTMRFKQVGLRAILRASVILSLVMPPLGCRAKNTTSGSRPNVVILLVDALRADSLHDYGNPRNTDPFLEEFGRRGVRFTNAHSHASNTLLSVATLFTGLIPPETGVRRAILGKSKGKPRSDALSSSLTTLAEVLKERRYSTAAFVANPHLQISSGLAQGFSKYEYFPGVKIGASELNDALLDWLKAAPRVPFFVYVHYMDLHQPYRAPGRYRFLYTEDKDTQPVSTMGFWRGPISGKFISQTRALYDAQINYWDDCFRALIGQMETGGWLKNTVFVIMADHGEEFYDHGGFGHTFTLYEEVLHIPLYIVYAGRLQPNQIREDLVRVIDIFPTIGDLTGTNLTALNLHGQALFPERKDKGGPKRISYAEAHPGIAPRSVQTLEAKLIFNSRRKSYEFYDLRRDPKEQKNAYDPKSPLCLELRTKLDQVLSLAGLSPKRQARELDQKTIELLKSLGYIK